jgi:hypothetical protein
MQSGGITPAFSMLAQGGAELPSSHSCYFTPRETALPPYIGG